jgi:zinc-binding alcohol dehydrogenase family protein
MDDTAPALPDRRPKERITAMKAVALLRYLPVDDPQCLVDVDLPMPRAEGHDLLVDVKAVSVNPVDAKVRAPKDKAETTPRVIGYDAAGIVSAVGPDVTLFKPGDEVWYAGDITRTGTNQQYHLVDARIAGRKPASLTFAEAAAMPLTTITAWEAMFDRLGIDPDGADKGQSILLIGGAGGVGSIAIQLARRAGLTVIATASRPDTISWVLDLGASHVVNHREDLVAQVRGLGFRHVDHIAIFNDMRHWAACVELIRPQGGIVAIDDTDLPMPMGGMKTKAASLHWEFMFARPMHQTPDMIEQHRLLNRVAGLVDAGEIRTTLTRTLSPINAATMREAHAAVESGRMIGKIVVEGF